MQNQEIQDARHDIQKAIKAYQESKEVRGEIDQLVENARSFNELLGILKKKGDKVLADINKYGK